MRVLIGVSAFIVLLSCNSKLRPSGQKTYNDSLYQQFWTADWSYDDKYIAVGGVDSILRIYHAETLELFKWYRISSWIHSVKWHPHENILAIATLDKNTQLLDVNSSNILILTDTTSPKLVRGYNGSRTLGWNYSGSLLAAGGLDGVIRLWNKQGQIVSWYADTLGSYLALDWHPAENLFVAANSVITIYDSSLKKVVTMKHANTEAIILSADWHPGGKFFVIGDYGHNWEGENVPSLLHFWSTNGQLLKSVAGSRAEYRMLKWNPSGSVLATASDVLRIWSKEGRLMYSSPPDGSNFMWGLSWNEAGNRIVTSSRHKTISLWDSKARLLKRIDVGSSSP